MKPASLLTAFLLLVLAVLSAVPSAARQAPADEKPTKVEAAQTDDDEKRPRPTQTLLSPGQFPNIEVTTPGYAWKGHPISLSLKEADLVEVLRSFAKIADVNMIIDPSVQGKVTVELKDVPWDQALYVILRINGLGMEISQNVWSAQRNETLYEKR